MEDNGVFCSASMGMCGRRFVRDMGVVVVGSSFAVPCGNRSVGGAGGGVEELTVQDKGFLLLH